MNARLLIGLCLFALGCTPDGGIDLQRPELAKVGELNQAIPPATSPAPTINLDELKAYPGLEELDERNAPVVKDTTRSPYFQIQSKDVKSDSFPLKSTAVKADISGVIADVNIRQVYTNNGDTTIEAVYVFPMSTKAAVYGMTMTLGDRKITADIQTREAARKNYEAAKSEGKTASLLEQKRPNVFKMNVANILPGDELIVDLYYTELLVPREQVYAFVFPTVVGPRFAETLDKGEGWIANPRLTQGTASPAKVSIDVNVNAPFPIRMARSPSHAINMQYATTKEARVSLNSVPQDKDFVLQYQLAGEEIASGLMVYEDGDESVFLAMIEPPAQPSADTMLPREYIYIVDVSGSMGGFPLSVSKAIVGTMLKNMHSRDHFNILFFAGGSQRLSETSLPVTQENIARAQTWLSEQHGGGSTQLLAAMQHALSIPKVQGSSRTLALVTDGFVSVEQQTFTLIREKLGEANLFAFGIGKRVNRHIIEGMARAGHGEPFIVGSKDDALVQGTRFANYIMNPVLTDIKVSFEGVETYDIIPAKQPDLFVSRPVVVYGKFKGAPKGNITISGTTAGAPYATTLSFEDAVSGDEQSALVQLWARQKIDELSDMNTLIPKGNEEREALKREITELGLKYNLMTKFTSFLAVDSAKRAEVSPSTIVQPLEGMGQLHNSNFRVNGFGMGMGAVVGSGRGGGGSGFGRITSSMGQPKIPRVVPKEPIVRGHLDKELIKRVIRAHSREIRRCYRREMSKNPNLKGRLVLRLVITEFGAVKTASVLRNALNLEVGACISAKARRWVFPEPKNGEVVVTYPFEMMIERQ